MDNENTDMGAGQVSPEEALRQLVQLRVQLGPARFNSVARQMGMPAELLDHIEQTVALMGDTEGGANGPAASGLVDASGRPISSGNAGGLVDATGRPLTPSAPSLDGLNGSVADEDADADEEGLEGVELDEESSRQLFQELVGVRMIIGPENFTNLAQQMGMPTEASEMVEVAAGQVEDEIASRYENQEEAMTVRLVNARMMMGQERFADFAGQVGMPAEVIDEVESIAGQIESGAGAADDDAEDDEDEGPSLA
ncbi:MAG TPA: hypothetical protein VFM49_13265 [Chloroflexia bacterium]|jgi:hypothetical protein|nr:hypothetical protein [Chloroflexia bacterium]